MGMQEKKEKRSRESLLKRGHWGIASIIDPRVNNQRLLFACQSIVCVHVIF